VEWVNQAAERGLPYDIRLSLEAHTVYVEVKTTANDAEGWWARNLTDIMASAFFEGTHQDGGGLL